MPPNSEHRRPIWPLLSAVTIAALAISYLRAPEDTALPSLAALFAMRWIFIAAFAMFGRAIFSRRSQ
jgi:polyferredoxin